MKKRITTLFLLALGVSTIAQAQTDVPGVGIGNPLPSRSAILDVTSTNKGVLVPRIKLTDLKTFGLVNDTKDEGMLIYNSEEVKNGTGEVVIGLGFYYWTNKIGTGQWEKVTSQSVVNNLTERITTVEKITGGGTGEGGGGTVVYVPGEDGKPGKLIIIDKTGNKEIPLEELLLGKETETFFKVVETKTGEGTAEEKIIKELYYYGEEAISKWILKDPKTNKREDASAEKIGTKPEDGVIKIDITSVVSSNFEKIVEDNSKVISETIQKLEGSMSIKVNDTVGDAKEGEYYFEIKKLKDDGTADDSEIIYLNTMETKTFFEKTIGNGTTGEPGNVKDAPTDLKAEGTIVYKFLGEEKDAAGKQIPYYINATSDFLEIVTKNKTIQEQITKVVNDGGKDDGGGTGTGPTTPTKPGENFGNVYYGIIDVDGKPVLYTKDGDKYYHIDISQNITNEITNNQELIEKLKEVTTTIIEEGKSSNTGEAIGGFAVKKIVFSKELKAPTTPGYTDYTYNSQFDGGFALQGEDKFGRVKSIQILNKDGQVVMSSVTDVVATAAKLDFKFGVGTMYSTLPVGNYDVIVEYISTEVFPEVKP